MIYFRSEEIILNKSMESRGIHGNFQYFVQNIWESPQESKKTKTVLKHKGHLRRE